MNSGRLTILGPPVTGSGIVVSLVPITTQPFWSTAFVKKSPTRRSTPVATQSVPAWHTVPSWIGRPEAFTTLIEGLAVSAPVTCASYAYSLAGWQLMSATWSICHQTTDTRPLSPAVTHGHIARVPVGCVIVIGFDHVLPKSRDTAMSTELVAGVSAPSQPPLVPGVRSSVSQTR